MSKSFDITTNGATVASTNSESKTDYVNLNCYVTKPGDEKPEWIFRASCVPTTRKATESILNKIKSELASKNIVFDFIEGNMKKEKEEMEELF